MIGNTPSMTKGPALDCKMEGRCFGPEEKNLEGAA